MEHRKTMLRQKTSVRPVINRRGLRRNESADTLMVPNKLASAKRVVVQEQRGGWKKRKGAFFSSQKLCHVVPPAFDRTKTLSKFGPSNTSMRRLVAPLTNEEVQRIQNFHKRNTRHLHRVQMKKKQKRLKRVANRCWRETKGIVEYVHKTRGIAAELQLYGNPLPCSYNNKSAFNEILSKVAKNAGKKFRLFTIHPKGVFSLVWGFLVGLLLLYSAFATPYRIAFGGPNTILQKIEYVTDFFFGLDIFINFLTAYYDDENQLVTSHSKIAKRYLTFWFYIDFAACFPFGLLMDGAGFNGALRLLRVMRLYRLFKIFSFANGTKTGGVSSVFEDLAQFNSFSVRLIMVSVTLLLCTHLFACLWYYTTSFTEGYSSWISYGGYENEPTYRLYLLSLYWAITTLTTVGYGDIHASNNSELAISIMWMMFGGCFYSFLLGTASSLASVIDRKGTELGSKFLIISEFCKEAQIGAELKGKMKRSIEYSTNNYFFGLFSKDSLFGGLSFKLRRKIAMNMENGLLKGISFFQTLDLPLLDTIIETLQPRKVEQGEVIYRRNDRADEIFFIAQGKVDFYLEHMQIIYKTMMTGSYFGDFEVIFKTLRLHTTRAKTESTVLCLSKDVYFQTIQKDYPDVAYKMIMEAMEKKRRTKKCLKVALIALMKQTMDAAVLSENVQKKGALSIGRTPTASETERYLLPGTDRLGVSKLDSSGPPAATYCGAIVVAVHNEDYIQTYREVLREKSFHCEKVLEPFSTRNALNVTTHYKEILSVDNAGVKTEELLNKLQEKLKENTEKIIKYNKILRELLEEHQKLFEAVQESKNLKHKRLCKHATSESCTISTEELQVASLTFKKNAFNFAWDVEPRAEQLLFHRNLSNVDNNNN